MTAPFEFSETAGLALAVLFGFFFGLSLERGGLGNPHRLTGVFYLRDFTVPKVMFTAILVAAGGLYLLSDAGLLDVSRVWIIPTYFWPQLLGGALFGLGYLVSGYCPGTGVAGFASGRIDALVMMIGLIAGSLLFAALFPLLENFYLSSSMGAATLYTIAATNHWIVLAFIAVLAGAMFTFFNRYEKKHLRS